MYGCDHPMGIWHERRHCVMCFGKYTADSWMLRAIWEFTRQKGMVCWHGAHAPVTVLTDPLLFSVEGIWRTRVRAMMALSVQRAVCRSHFVLQKFSFLRVTSPENQMQKFLSPVTAGGPISLQ